MGRGVDALLGHTTHFLGQKDQALGTLGLDLTLLRE
jgi:hypothetical protein